MVRVAITTLGCKVNQCESAEMAGDLTLAGHTVVPFGAEADCYIINTCTVTGRADFQSRQLIRRALRRNPEAAVVVTGCMAQRIPEELGRMTGVRAVVGNAHKNKISSIVASLPGKPPLVMVDAVMEGDSFFSNGTTTFPGHTRAFLKIQDGCNGGCTYCIVPQVRGPARSLPWRDVVERATVLDRAGYREIVLTGIHLGSYGRDCSPLDDLTALIRRLAESGISARLRLSSVEPLEITDELIGIMAEGLVCPHLHIPLQSGDDGILAAMGRNYDSAFFQDLVGSLVKAVPRLAVGIDVMVGFPGEDEQAFCRTLRLVEELPLAYLHVFSYSPRPGTTASLMTGQVPEGVKKERSERLREAGRRKRREFSERFIGKSLEVLVEARLDKATGFHLGLSENYLAVAVAGTKATGKIVRVVPASFSEGRLIATVGEGLPNPPALGLSTQEA